ncbi:DNA polymerase-3 subunit epsilon [Tenacibaculum skagerrakense]|uniref:DNA polymerase-3 subunit epsilon n=1 Tax=Tenacibaculum skagerrakense TaxID=186571 RepID=A0A4R2NMC7_9FLAO|nr:3'-5' exonuclease [Tenacibaculum skagerrakense]TCP22652.1 DNA polymerase-3 subunit epsilon [Tenacibaculum skagerrakense]
MKWFQRKAYPDFWKNYTDSFKAKQNDLKTTRFVVFDTETTGLNPKVDKILSIGTVAVSNFSIDVADSLECYVIQENFNADTVPIHGILKEGNITKITEEEAIIQFLNHIKNAVLIAHHANFDIQMINEALHRLGLPKLKNKVLDTGVLYKKTKYVNRNNFYSLDELCEIFKITKHDRHTASGDAFLTALIFLKILSLLKRKNSKLQLKHLFTWI